MKLSWTGSGSFHALAAGVLVTAAIAAVTPAAAQTPEPSTTDLATASVEPSGGPERLIIRRGTNDGGAPIFDSIPTDMSGIMRIAADPTVTGIELDGTSELMWRPTDPAYGVQWESQLTGMETAWDVTRGDPSIIIAILDSGVKPGPEFGDRLLPGQSFTGNDPHVDGLGHGTSVAAIAGAEANNDTAGAGVCSRCSILPVQVADSSGHVPWSAAANGIIWAVDQGADVLNLSFGSQSPSAVLRDSVEYAISRGVVVVAAAGNFGTDTMVYPANFPGVLSVAGHNQAWNRQSWSSYGQWVDVAAPGCVLGLNWDSPTTVCGTSFASPWVAGAAALVRTVSGPLDSTQVSATIENTTIANDWVRTGRIDASLLLQGGVASLDPIPGRISAGTLNLTGAYRGNVSRVDLLVDGTITGADDSPADGRFELMWDASSVVPGDHVIRVQAVDARGGSIPGDEMTVQVYAGSGFDDVVRFSYYEKSVVWMVGNGITSGVTNTTFEPDNPVTRAQLATFLWRYSGNPSAVTAASFADTPTGSWFSPAVNWMVDTGITSGVTNTTFEPDTVVTRAQIATFLWRHAGNPQPSTPAPFDDVVTNSWYGPAVGWMTETGITTGTTATTFSPHSVVTRAQLAAFLWRYAGSPKP